MRRPRIFALGQPLRRQPHVAFLALTVLNLVGGFLVLGTLLAVGIMMLPAFIARFWTRNVTAMIAVAIGSAALSGYAGLAPSYQAGSARGALPSSWSRAPLYVLSVAAGPVGGLVWLVLPRRQSRGFEAAIHCGLSNATSGVFSAMLVARLRAKPAASAK